MKEKIDEIDKKILKILQNNCKVKLREASNKLGIPKSTLHNRISRLKKEGIIKGCRAILDPFKLGYRTIAWVGLTVEPDKIEEIAKKIMRFEEVQIVATSAGHHDVVFQVITKDERELGEFINKKIKTIEGVKTGVGMIHVSSFLNIYKFSQEVPL